MTIVDDCVPQSKKQSIFHLRDANDDNVNNLRDANYDNDSICETQIATMRNEGVFF